MTEPATSNIIDCGGGLITRGLIHFAIGFGHALGKKVKLINSVTPRYTQTDISVEEREMDWYGTSLTGIRG